MKIIKLSEKIEERRNIEILGVKRLPSNVSARQDQLFYDYYTRQKFRGASKYELNKEVYKLAQRKDEIGILAQFCLQLERESIASDDDIVNNLDNIKRSNIDNDIEKMK
jgi:hypothetical protein